MTAHIQAIGTATPAHDVHQVFIDWARARVEPRAARLFDRMVSRAGIRHRWSVLPQTPDGGSPITPLGFYGADTPPGTAARMEAYAVAAPSLAMDAIGALAEQIALDDVSHLVVASCTGFVAPGIDQIIAAQLGLGAHVERLLVGYMGCYAAVVALRNARHIVRSVPEARVLVVTVELSTLHMQPDTAPGPLLAQLQFGDGAAAALVTADPRGLAIGRPFSRAVDNSADLIRWHITDRGFVMHLDGAVPARIANALGDPATATAMLGGRSADAIDGWAVHAGGRSILDAVEAALDLPADALAASRGVLAECGNMSSATLMFVLARMLAGPRVTEGVALAFGPGLAAEGFGFRHA